MAAPSVKRFRSMESEDDNLNYSLDNDSSSYVLTSFPQILKLILNYIPAKSLNNCARVCKIWRDGVEKAKKHRRPYYWHFFECDKDDEENREQLLKSIQTTIEDLRIQPDTMIVFYTSLLLHTPFIPCRTIKKKSTRKQQRFSGLTDFFYGLLPPNCHVTAVAADGIIGTSCDLSKTEEFENKCALSFICFSKMENLELHTRQQKPHETANLVEAWNTNKELFHPHMIPVSARENVKSFIFFSDDNTVPQEFGFALYKQFHQSLIVGGFVDSLLPNPGLIEKCGLPNVTFIALCGEHVQVASVIIRDDIYDKLEVESCVKELKSHGLPEDRSLAFMFACIGRGENHYGEANVESAIFRKHFPKTPLLGMFGNGEVGFKYPLPIPTEHTDDGTKVHEFVKHPEKYRTRHPPKLYHSYTTIFCLISFP